MIIPNSWNLGKNRLNEPKYTAHLSCWPLGLEKIIITGLWEHQGVANADPWGMAGMI